jgi:hypothetical protein
MSTLAEIQHNLTFLNTGPNQAPGVIVMKLDANGGDYGPYRHIVVVFNAADAQVTFTDPQLRGMKLRLHPEQKGSADPMTRTSSFDAQQGTATVPALTTAVFVSEKE